MFVVGFLMVSPVKLHFLLRICKSVGSGFVLFHRYTLLTLFLHQISSTLHRQVFTNVCCLLCVLLFSISLIHTYSNTWCFGVSWVIFWAPDLPEHVKHHNSLADPAIYDGLRPVVVSTTLLKYVQVVVYSDGVVSLSGLSRPVSLLCWVSDQVLMQLVRLCQSYPSLYLCVWKESCVILKVKVIQLLPRGPLDPITLLLSSFLQNLVYRRNRNGDSRHPCLTTILTLMLWDGWPAWMTLHDVPSYEFLIKFVVLVGIP